MEKYVKQSMEYDMRIASGASERAKDLEIWKSYSKRGGVHDALQDFCKAVKHPSVNAFDYDEEEKTYIICITLYNTIWMRMDAEMGRLTQNLAAAERQKQEYIPATHTRTYTEVKKVPQSKKPHPESNANRILRFFKALDKGMMRFKAYALIHNAIAGLFPSKRKRYECTETVYEEKEVKLALYKSRYSPLLDIIRDIIADIGKSLPLIQGEDRQALEHYKHEAQRICSSIEEKVFSRQEWLL